MWILYAGVSKTQEDTLQVFIIKIECARITGDRDSQQNNNGNWQAKHKILLLLYDYLGLKTMSYNSTPAKYI